MKLELARQRSNANGSQLQQEIADVHKMHPEDFDDEIEAQDI